MAFDFTGKIALVTGGSAGIGAEISKGIVAGGGHVVVCARNEEAGKKFVEELGEETTSIKWTSPMPRVLRLLSQRFLKRSVTSPSLSTMRDESALFSLTR